MASHLKALNPIQDIQPLHALSVGISFQRLGSYQFEVFIVIRQYYLQLKYVLDCNRPAEEIVVKEGKVCITREDFWNLGLSQLIESHALKLSRQIYHMAGYLSHFLCFR